jgi:hypothetical protein
LNRTLWALCDLRLKGAVNHTDWIRADKDRTFDALVRRKCGHEDSDARLLFHTCAAAYCPNPQVSETAPITARSDRQVMIMSRENMVKAADETAYLRARAIYYRSRAGKMRARAERVQAQEARALFIQLEESWLRLAETAERSQAGSSNQGDEKRIGDSGARR